MMMSDIQLRTHRKPDCVVCGTRGVPLYQGLRDCLYNVPGEWDLKKCPDPQCGLVWLDPMPIEDDISKAYQAYYTHDSSAQETFARTRQGLFLRCLFKYFKHGYLAARYNYKSQVSVIQQILSYGLLACPSLPRSLSRGIRYVKYVHQGKLLDVGCGDGSYMQYMQVLGWEVKGVDFDSAAVDNARAKGLMVQLGTLEQQAYPDNTFDVITINHVIEHVPDPLRLILECQRLMKPDGKLVITTPNVASWGHRMYGACWRGLEPPRHLHIFTPASLVALIEQVGLRVVDLSTRAGSFQLFLASQYICMDNKSVSSRRNSFKMRALAKVLEIFEGFINLVKKDSGQELILISSKEE